jgi:hypothetical protein
MASPLPQYHENNLHPIEIGRSALLNVQNKLLLAIHQGLKLLNAREPAPQGASEAICYGNISHGDLGGLFDEILDQ